jgi:hypothetical protein
MGQHCVRVIFKYGHDDWDPLFELEEALMAAVEQSGMGEFDGNEIAMDNSTCEYFMYGPNADDLFAVVRPILETSSIVVEGVATLRYGGVDEEARVSVVLIGKHAGGQTLPG